ncbi:HEAT repeat domain-containing protein [Pseudonocardia sp. N23]|uniref:HEAT repeat domain-containing protein n=1 Tax=Pseudonocardia sp. N23 TaxID=1987376 RepID=UPI000BFD1652|nr:hypothetical protein TOK_3279 [Pseudonocardia sp. N23]
MTPQETLVRALVHGDASVRLRAALAAGTSPDPGYVDTLVARCAVEPDFSVREMLTWALIRQSPASTVPLVVAQLRSGRAQARSQALHTLSKIQDPRTWPAITRELLTDPDDEVARAAWRTAVGLAPEGERLALAEVLVTQLGRGSREVQLSLSRALIGLGEVMLPALQDSLEAPDPLVRHHAVATQRLLRDPEAGFELAVEAAKRVVALGGHSPEG